MALKDDKTWQNKKETKNNAIVITTQDGTLACLLGASPGASTAVSIMIDILNKCFQDKMQQAEWQNKMKEMIPSYGQSLNDNPEFCMSVQEKTGKVLKLQH